MTRRLRAIVPALVIGLLLGSAVTRDARADTPGAFPHLEPWPYTLSMGGAPSALGEGIEAVLENPTGMLHDPARGAAVSHASLFGGGLVRHQAAAACWTRHHKKVIYEEGEVYSKRGAIRDAIGIGVTNLSGDLPGEETYGELGIALSYARSFPLGLQSGFRLHFLQARSTVDGTDGGGYAFDLGLERSLRGWRVGGVVRALVSEVRWDRSLDGPIPTGYDLALARELRAGLTTMLGATLRDDWQPRRLVAAAEWTVPGAPLVLRLAPAWRDTGIESDLELSGGAGLTVGGISIAYAMRTGPTGLGEIHRFGLSAILP